jgi:hypothetical protein
MPKFGILIKCTVRSLQELFKKIGMPKFDLHIEHVVVNSWLFKQIRVQIKMCGGIDNGRESPTCRLMALPATEKEEAAAVAAA